MSVRREGAARGLIGSQIWAASTSLDRIWRWGRGWGIFAHFAKWNKWLQLQWGFLNTPISSYIPFSVLNETFFLHRALRCVCVRERATRRPTCPALAPHTTREAPLCCIRVKEANAEHGPNWLGQGLGCQQRDDVLIRRSQRDECLRRASEDSFHWCGSCTSPLTVWSWRGK